MEKVMARGEQLGREAQTQQARRVAAQLRMLFGGASVRAEEGRVLVSGRGIVKRWLIDPSRRFLAGGLK